MRRQALRSTRAVALLPYTTLFRAGSPPDPRKTDSEVICEAWASGVCPQVLDTASYQLPLSVDEAPGRFIDAEPALLPTKLRTGLMVLFMVFSPLRDR